MAHLTPKAGSKIVAISAYMPQHNITQGAQNYREVLTWLDKRLTEDFPDTSILMEGDLQATPSPNHCAHNQALENFSARNEMKLITTPFLSGLCYGPVHVGV